MQEKLNNNDKHKHNNITDVRLIILFAILPVMQCLVPSCIAGQNHNPDNCNVIWTRPSKDSHGSMPVGNGDIGANVWVEQNGDILLLLSKTDAWSENARLLKLGKIRITCSPALYNSGDSFRQELNLTDGVININTRGKNHNANVKIWVDANNPVLRIEITNSKAAKVTVQSELWRKTRRKLTGQELRSAYGLLGRPQPVYVMPDTVLANQKDRIVFLHNNKSSVWQQNLELQGLGQWAKNHPDPLLHRIFGVAVEGKNMISSNAEMLISRKPARNYVISVFPLTLTNTTVAQWQEKLQHNIKRIEQISLKQAFKAHKQWWHNFWQRSWINVSGDNDALAVAKAYTLQRWINACGGRGHSPIKFNGTIFTVDTWKRNSKGQITGGFDPDYRNWGGCYWWQNTRLPYWSMLKAGDFDLMKPLFTMYMDSLNLRKFATGKYYHHAGAFYPETQYFWGTYNGNNYGWNRKNKPDGLTDNHYIRYYWQGGIELVAMMIDYYHITGDKQFCDNTLVPMAKNIMTFYNQHWSVGKDGKIRFCPAQSLETWWVAVNPLPIIAGLRYVLPELIKLPVTNKQRDTWQKMLGKLPPVPQEKKADKYYLLPAQQYSSKHNMENPELYAVFPYKLYTLSCGREKLRTGINTFSVRKYRGTGGWQQNAIQAALLGLSSEAQKMVVSNAHHWARGFRFTAFWGPNFDWIPDQDHGSVTMIALQDMLLQFHNDKIYIFPAWPKQWNVSFKLWAPQNTYVTAKLNRGKLQELTVFPSSRKKDIILPAWLTKNN